MKKLIIVILTAVAMPAVALAEESAVEQLGRAVANTAAALEKDAEPSKESSVEVPAVSAPEKNKEDGRDQEENKVASALLFGWIDGVLTENLGISEKGGGCQEAGQGFTGESGRGTETVALGIWETITGTPKENWHSDRSRLRHKCWDLGCKCDCYINDQGDKCRCS